MDNLILAAQIAQIGKDEQPSVIRWNKDPEGNLKALQQELLNETYWTSPYTYITVFEPKERLISRLPFKDRVVHHAIMNILEKMFVATFTADTYSCIKGRGIHKAEYTVIQDMRNDPEGTYYFAQMDICKFYPRVKNDILKQLLRRKIKCKSTLRLLDGIIDSAIGVPIGNYLSQYFANFYLSYFDHWLKEVKGVKYYYRYADDLVILGSSKVELHQLVRDIIAYMAEYLQMEIKGNWKVRPVHVHGINFLGYIIRHTYIRIRKSIKQAFARAVVKTPKLSTIAAYLGWLLHCNSTNLIKKILPDEHFQRFRDRNARRKKVYRFKNRTLPSIRREDRHSFLQNRTKQISEQGGLPDNANNLSGGKTNSIHKFNRTNEGAKPSTRR